MAFDTQNKRLSALTTGLAFRGALPVPDGSLSSRDRLMAGYWFSTIAPLGSGAEVISDLSYTGIEMVRFKPGSAI
jgi:hypothetical protein